MPKQIEGQLAMPFIGAVEGASLEAQVARVQRHIEGLNADQLRKLYREQKRDGIHHHVARVIEDALIGAIRAQPSESEDMPNKHGVIEKAQPDWCVSVLAIEMRIFTGRTRWGYVAAVDYKWRAEQSGSSPLKIVGDTFRTRALAGAALLDEFADRLLHYTSADLSDENLRDCATVIAVVTERAFLLRVGLWPRGESTKHKKTRASMKAPARKKLRPPGVTATSSSKTPGRDGEKAGLSPSPDRRGSSGARRASDKKAGTGAGGPVRAAATIEAATPSAERIPRRPSHAQPR